MDDPDPDPDPDSAAAEFQDYITSMAWGVWTRAGALTPRDRSLLVMAMTAAPVAAALAPTSEAIAFGRAAGFSNSLMAKDVRL
jgi:alkylhydroperoxidase/carboxymuconolactone decarboxylase family protein YurZ